MLNLSSSCNLFVSRIAGETPKDYRNRWWDEYYAIGDRYGTFDEIQERDGFWCVKDGQKIAYFSDLGHFG